VTDKAPVDRYTIAHFIFGVLAKRAGWSTGSIVLGSVAYEIVEPVIISKIDTWTPETPKNIVIDVLAAWVGSTLVK
jgi:hypothetical protein